MKNRVLLLAVVLLACLPAWGGAISFTENGAFVYDNDVVLFQLQLLTPSYIEVYTTSWAAGGFAPHLELFDGTGTMQYAQSNGGVPACIPNGPAPVRSPNSCGDAEVHEGPFLTDEMPIGSYIIALSQADNYSDGSNVFDPFVQAGPDGRNYTAIPGVCSSYFCDQVFLTPNTPNWSMTVTLERVGSTPDGTLSEIDGVPEPASMALFTGGLAAIVILKRRRSRR